MNQKLRRSASWLLALSVFTLAGCQTTQGPTPHSVSPSLETTTTSPTQTADIWVDLTPYPKSNSGQVATDVLSHKDDVQSGEIGQWAVRYEDETIRHALQRWAHIAGWSFDNSHYDINMDIPITAEAVLVERGTFQQGVQALMEAVALSDYPIRACFYQNKVLRIIAYNGSCNARLN